MITRHQYGLLRLLLSASVSLLIFEPASAVEVTDPPQCKNCFIGELRLSPNVADPSGHTKILDADFFYVDGNALVWKAGAGDITDGASIPELLQPLVGSPWEKSYLAAAVMHDHYTKDVHKVRTWQATARMFFSAMVVGNVEIIRAKLMYYAVYVFGPHWDKLRTGTPCGHNCVFLEPLQVTFKPAEYDVKLVENTKELDELKAIIAKREIAGQPMALSDIENLAIAKHPDNVFFLNDNTR